MTTPILMSFDNPKGWPLEDLVQQLQTEVRRKDQRLLEALPGCHDDYRRAVFERVTGNNKEIIALLDRIERLQRESMTRLDTLGPDQGPTGKSRIAGD